MKILKNKILLILFETILIIIIFLSVVKIYKWQKDNKHTAEIVDKITDNITVENDNYNINFEKLKDINKDIIAYIVVNGTNIRYPVVKGEDNTFYLTHSLDKQENNAGWIFADYRNKLDETDKNVIIYGHNRKDGTMFRTLRNIFNKEWYSNKENRKIKFITEKENCIYEVFSVYKILNEDYYIKTDFENDSFDIFLKTIKERSVVNFETEISENDKILTLSTCDNNNKYRVVLHAKKVLSY